MRARIDAEQVGPSAGHETVRPLRTSTAEPLLVVDGPAVSVTLGKARSDTTSRVSVRLWRVGVKALTEPPDVRQAGALRG